MNGGLWRLGAFLYFCAYAAVCAAAAPSQVIATNFGPDESYGTPAFKVRGVLFLRLWEDNETLVVRTEIDRREDMIEEDPETYFLTDHYLNYPWILVRLPQIKREALREMIVAAWQLASKKRSRRTK